MHSSYAILSVKARNSLAKALAPLGRKCTENKSSAAAGEGRPFPPRHPRGKGGWAGILARVIRGGSPGGCAGLRPQVLRLHSEAWFSSSRPQPSSPKGTVTGFLGSLPGTQWPQCGPGPGPVPSAVGLALSPLCSSAWPGHSLPRRRLPPSLKKSNQCTDGLDLLNYQSVLRPGSSLCSSGSHLTFPTPCFPLCRLPEAEEFCPGKSLPKGGDQLLKG